MANFQNIVICALAGFAISFGVIALGLRFWRQLVANPLFAQLQQAGQSRTPPLGGPALAAAFALPCLALEYGFGLEVDPLHRVILTMTLAICALGLWNDALMLHRVVKMGGQVLIASITYFWGLGIHQLKIPLTPEIIDLGGYGWPVTVGWLLLTTNILRLIDGADGLAGVVALMLMILLTVISGAGDIAPLIAVGMAGALLAFLQFNLPPARVRMGAGGAYLLGFLVGSLSIYNTRHDKVVAALIAPLLVLTVPFLDALFAVWQRYLLGLPLFGRYGKHLDQRLLQAGVSKERLALGTYVFTAIFLVLALVAFCWRGQSLPVVASGGVLALLWLASRLTSSRNWFSGRSKSAPSRTARRDVQFALAQSDWLGLEGLRAASLEELCEDTAWVAGKLGFASLKIHLEDKEKNWHLLPPDANPSYDRQPMSGTEGDAILTSPSGARCHVYRHRLATHPACWLELQTPDLARADNAPDASSPMTRHDSTFEIISQVLADGWMRSLNHWRQKNKQERLRF